MQGLKCKSNYEINYENWEKFAETENRIVRIVRFFLHESYYLVFTIMHVIACFLFLFYEGLVGGRYPQHSKN